MKGKYLIQIIKIQTLSTEMTESVCDVEESSTPEQIIKNVDNIKLRRCYQLIIKTLYWLFGFFTNTSK